MAVTWHISGKWETFHRDRCWINFSQLPHSYYFTTHILVLKFVNEGVFFEEIQDWHFPRKREYFGTHLREFWEKVNFYVQCFTVKKGFIWAEKSVFYCKRGVHFGLNIQCFIAKRGSFWAKKGVIFKLENKDGYHFFQWVRERETCGAYYITTGTDSRYWTD